MRVTHRMIADAASQRLRHSLARMDRYAGRLSTGKVFDRPSQDPVGLVKVLRLGAVIKRNEQFRLNMNEARGWLEGTEGSLRSALDTVQRIRELSIYGANEVLTAGDRLALTTEVLELYNNLVDTANRQYNGLYIFAGHQTMRPPFSQSSLYRVEADPAGGLDAGALQAAGLQNGRYSLDLARTLSAGEPAVLEPGQTVLRQASAGTIFGRGALEAPEDAATLEAGASLLLEVVRSDPATGEVVYRYTAYGYGLDGSASLHAGEASLHFGGAPGQLLDLGVARVAVNGLEGASPGEASLLSAGDRAVYTLLPARQAGQEYQEVQLSGEHRGGGSSFRAIFNDGVLDGGTAELRFVTLNTFAQSSHRGEACHGSITLSGDAFGEARPAAVFHYDQAGFPSYGGDGGSRNLEISPHQVMAMNLAGRHAFGGRQEVFQAVREAYWALAENDRALLGGAVMEGLDGAIDLLLQRIAEVGARQQRVETMQETLFSENLYLREMRSRVEDIDLALTIAEFTMQESAYRAALAATARIIQPSLVDFLR